MITKGCKYIFVSGGVLSGLGKGVVAASIANLLQNRGYKITVIKCENYLNIETRKLNSAFHTATRGSDGEVGRSRKET